MFILIHFLLLHLYEKKRIVWIKLSTASYRMEFSTYFRKKHPICGNSALLCALWVSLWTKCFSFFQEQDNATWIFNTRPAQELLVLYVIQHWEGIHAYAITEFEISCVFNFLGVMIAFSYFIHLENFFLMISIIF